MKMSFHCRNCHLEWNNSRTYICHTFWEILNNCKHPYLVPHQYYPQSAESVAYQSLHTIAQAFIYQVLKSQETEMRKKVRKKIGDEVNEV